MFFVWDEAVNGFVHWTFPVNFGKKIGEVDAERGGDKQQVVIRDAQQTAFNFGDGAAGGVVPAGEL